MKYSIIFIFALMSILISCRKREQYINSEMPTFVNKKMIYDYEDSSSKTSKALMVSFTKNNSDFATDNVYTPRYISQIPSVGFFDFYFYPTNIKITIGAVHSISESSGLFGGTNTFLFLPFEIKPDVYNYDIKNSDGKKVFTHNILTQDSIMRLPFGDVKVNGIIITRHYDKKKELIYYNKDYGVVKYVKNYGSNPNMRSTLTLSEVQ